MRRVLAFLLIVAIGALIGVARYAWKIRKRRLDQLVKTTHLHRSHVSRSGFSICHS